MSYRAIRYSIFGVISSIGYVISLLDTIYMLICHFTESEPLINGKQPSQIEIRSPR